MRRLLSLLIVVTIAAILLINFNPNLFENIQKSFSYAPCDTPIEYSVGSVDKQFNITNRQLIDTLREAANIWNKAYSKELFEYDNGAKLTVNMVFDERQSLTNQISQQENTIDSQKGKITPEIAAYNKRVSDFEKRVSDFNAKVKYWNDRGGAPSDEYDKLQKEQDDLNAELRSINDIAKSLNLSANTLNSQIHDLNSQISTFNRTIAQKPEEGIYDGEKNRIDIYFNVNHNELVHTLAHELGHARGLEHLSNPIALMYAKTNSSLAPSSDDLAQLDQVCAKQGILENLKKALGQSN